MDTAEISKPVYKRHLGRMQNAKTASCQEAKQQQRESSRDAKVAVCNKEVGNVDTDCRAVERLEQSFFFDGFKVPQESS